MLTMLKDAEVSFSLPSEVGSKGRLTLQQNENKMTLLNIYGNSTYLRSHAVDTSIAGSSGFIFPECKSACAKI